VQSSPGKVLDATAGLGCDAFVMAAHGYRVTLLERMPAVAWLLWDGLRRALCVPRVAPVVQRMQLHWDDAQRWMMGCDDQAYQAVYLDPMFPAAKKKAQVKKEMQMFRMMVGADDDSSVIFNAARRLATHKIVVKRARLAPCLADYQPLYSLTGKSSRFDIYAAQSMVGADASIVVS